MNERVVVQNTGTNGFIVLHFDQKITTPKQGEKTTNMLHWNHCRRCNSHFAFPGCLGMTFRGKDVNALSDDPEIAKKCGVVKKYGTPENPPANTEI